MSSPVFRFAPSPNGELHIGHARSALVGYDWARERGGRFLVRLEDIDIGRVRPRFVDGIFEDLAWLGVTWEKPVLRQSEHFPVYRAAADYLSELGLTFPCFASRNEIEIASARAGLPRDPDGAPLYPGIARNRSLGEVKARIAAGERYFEGLIGHYFLNNPHRTTVVLTPDPELARREAEAEQAT